MTLTQIKPLGLSKPVDLADNEKIRLGTGNDLHIYHDGSASRLHSASHPFYIRSGGQFGVFKGDGSESMIVAEPNGAVELYYDNSKKFETHSNGCIFTGSLYGLDNNKIELGNSNDLQIYHDGTNSRINNTTGKLLIKDDIIEFVRQADDTVSFKVYEGGSTELYHNHSKKFETTSSGVLISGHLDLNDGNAVKLGSGDDLQIYHDGTNSRILNNTGNLILFPKTGEYSVVCIPDGAVELYHNNSKKFETQSAGVNVEGAIIINHTAGTDGKGEIAFGESGRPFIDGFDNGNHGSGAGFDFRAGNGDYFIKTRQDAAVELYHNNSKKVQTESAGITVFGSTQVDGTCHPYSDNASDLGLSGNRWQDLYLSGNIYLGGTGSANALDDYEKGTWTPVLGATSSDPSVSSYSHQHGQYTKIGNVVHLFCFMDIPANGITAAGSGDGLIRNLPFVISNSPGSSDSHGAAMDNIKQIPNSFSAQRNNAKLFFGNSEDIIRLHQYNATNPIYETGWGSSQIANGNRFKWGWVATYETHQ